jgi:hypothetical protein
MKKLFETEIVTRDALTQTRFLDDEKPPEN